MKKTTKMHYILCMAIVCFAACKKSEVIQEEQQKPEIEVPVVPPTTPPTTNPPIPPLFTYEVGTGSGGLIIDGKTLSIKGPTVIKIKAGNYSSISVKNFIQDEKTPVYVKNNGLVEITGNESIFSNLNNVIFSGDGTSGLKYGFAFHNINNGTIKLDKNSTVNNFTLQFTSFKNIGNNVIEIFRDVVYNGTPASFMQNLRFLNLDCDNTGTLISTTGSISSGTPKGVIKNLEIAYVNYRNSDDVGSAFYVGNAEDYNIHHNTITNVNMKNNSHNSIFMMKGNGKFYNNKISNHQGNTIRAWAFTLGSTPKTILIYNNIVTNSKKYSPFEVQSFQDYMYSGISTYANVKVFNNTSGNINLSKDWQGNVVDVYNLFGGKCEVYNNLAYNHFSNGVNVASFGGQQSSLKPIESNNLYFANAKDAGIVDEVSFKISASSPAKGKGKHESISTTDFYGTTRAQTPSIGAVE